MRYLGILTLSVVAIFFGGCSLLFTPTIVTAGFGILPLIWLSGFAIAAVCFLGIKRILSRPKVADQSRAAARGAEDDRVG